MRDQVTCRISGSGRRGSLSLAGSPSRSRNFELKPGLERDRLHQALFAHDTPHEMTSISHPIPHRSSPGSKRTAPSVPHQDGGEKYATGVTTSKIHVRNNITIGTWNVRTLRMAGKLEELSYEMSRYRWNILGLCEVRWKNFGETSTDEGHKLYFCGINYTSAARRTSAGNLGPVP